VCLNVKKINHDDGRDVHGGDVHDCHSQIVIKVQNSLLLLLEVDLTQI
jgi:hypothetical protein